MTPQRSRTGLFLAAPALVLIAIVVGLIIQASAPCASAASLEVGQGAPYSTINAAVGAAGAGDVIRVHGGTYDEQVDIAKSVVIEPFGDGPVIVDGECARDFGFYITRSDISVRGLVVKQTVQAGVLIEGADEEADPPANVTIDGMTIQDFDCTYRQGSEEPESYGQFRAGVAAWYAGSNITVTDNIIKHRVEITPNRQQGSADGIWFKSNDDNPSGGGHYIARNTIVGGWDGIGGEEEGSDHGTFDKDTIVEDNTISDCWDDGVQVEGGNQNVIVRDNHIEHCALGVAFAPTTVGPLYITDNTILDFDPDIGLYGESACFKIGNGGEGVAHVNGNICSIPFKDPETDEGANGFKQTNEGANPIVSRNNVIQVGRYAIVLDEPAPGTSFDGDCLFSSDPERFIKWDDEYYETLGDFTSTTGQEENGIQGTDCADLPPIPTPTTQVTTNPTAEPTLDSTPDETPDISPTPTETPPPDTPAPTATPTQTPIADTGPPWSQTATPTPSPTSQVQLLGDANCDSEVDSADALGVLLSVSGLNAGAGCLLLADVDCDSSLSAVDALFILRFTAALPVPPLDDCPNIGGST